MGRGVSVISARVVESVWWKNRPESKAGFRGMISIKQIIKLLAPLEQLH